MTEHRLFNGLTASERRSRRDLLEEKYRKLLPVPAAEYPKKEAPKPIPTKEELRMGLPQLFIVGADKGGVGKTTVSRTLLDYFASQGVEVRAFDTENEVLDGAGAPIGVLKRFFPEKTRIVDLMHSNGQMEVFDDLKPGSVTVIDIRATLLTPTLKLLAEVGLLDLVREKKVDLAVLHVIGPTIASFNEIKATTDLLADARHYIVKNHINNAEFFKGIDTVAKDVLQGASVIDIPKLDETATEHVEAASMPFKAFTEDPKQSFVMKGKVRTWLAQVFKQFDGVKINSQQV